MAILDGKPRRPSLVRSGFPAPLEEFLLKCLQAEPEKRYADAQEANGALLSVAELIRGAGAGAGKIEGRLVIPPIRGGAGEDGGKVAAGLRRDLASELARIQGLQVAMVEEAELRSGEPFDFVLRAALEMELPRGQLDLAIQRYEARNGARTLRAELHERIEQEDPDEWTLQADLVRAAARLVRRRLTEFSLKPSEDTGRDQNLSLQLTEKAHDLLLRGTTKHLMSAISSLRRAIDADPYCAEAYAGMAEALVRKFLYWDGDTTFLDEAREYAQRALALDQSSAAAHCSLGFAYHLSGHQSDALREYRVAIQLDEDSWLAHRLLGSILRRDGNFKDAATHLRRAIELHPGHIGSYDHLYSVLRRLDKTDEAIATAQAGVAAGREMLRTQADNQEARLFSALLLARTGRDGAARRVVERALELSPKDGYTGYLAGCVLAVLGEPEAAIEHIKKAHDRGFYVRSELRNNEDLDLLRGLPEFEDLLR
jgi:tetratricopeptide (TPR) repeat protein